jgi:hypothetical protein
MEIRPAGAELFDAEGKTDRDVTKLIGALRNFDKGPKK